MSNIGTISGTHPWLTFSADLREAPVSLWVLLGECQSKCQHIAGVPMRPEDARLMYQLYLVKGVLATTAIEGNTLSEKEVLQHLEGKLKLPASREYLAQEIDNILSECNSILANVRSSNIPGLNVDRVKQLNKIVLDKLPIDEDVVPGEIRKHEVGVGRYKAPSAPECENLLSRLCDWLNHDDFHGPAGMELVYSIFRAVLAHLYLAWIHPFGDGNGRTARLIEFQILISSGIPAPACHLLSNHYNQTRTKYYRQLDAASRSGGNIIPFLEYAVQGLAEGLRAQIDHIRMQQWEVSWENYVHNAFRDRSGPTQERRRHLVLDVSRHGEHVTSSQIMELTPRLTRAYSNRTKRTVWRDLLALNSMGLLAFEEKKGWRARKESILAFLPTRVEQGPDGETDSGISGSHKVAEPGQR